jgi:hypothetical protein
LTYAFYYALLEIMTNITITHKQSYGNDHLYITGDKADNLKSLLGKKTVNLSDLKNLLKLGVKFDIDASSQTCLNITSAINHGASEIIFP